MAHSPGTYADLDALRERAVALRRAGHSLRQIRDELKIFNNDVLNRLVKGEPPPEWTKRPRAKDDLRARARELRLQGWTYDRIETELGCSRSSVSLWVRDLPRPERKRTREEASAIAKKGWEEKLRLRDEDRRRTKEVARQAIGGLSARELFLVGVGLYWAEGGKDKPYDRRENVTFVNSDPGMIEVFLAWLDLLEVDRDRLRFTVMIHETAYVGAAERYWADLVGAPSSSFNKTTIKKHNPKTVRKNTGDGYRGCLVIKVLKGADLYRRIEGSWYGIVEAAREADQSNRT
ncbi:helix-turn-helix domain-containing protein [Streptomyces albidocamelliae]|uniref:Helix-turn-helix domain-containing protein n=1 Tax=Streptomyces albidocamelliae TaxID=2981135 RepID=A0ABY6ESC6_9ACTN|nr:helix-turn-helix domain-containing protein [Streptomyces sp. HUAS 14-6]UXY37285.1 helix-turn-helix domain-containing protein [Streptomyces sp. HUAS 14-6]